MQASFAMILRMLVEFLLCIAIVLGLVNLVVSFLAVKRMPGKEDDSLMGFLTASDQLRTGIETRIQGLEKAQRELQKDLSSQMSLFYKETRTLSEKLENQQRANSDAVSRSLENIRTENWKTLEMVAQTVTALSESVQKGMDAVRADSNTQLERIRGTVENKLQETLDKRLTSSFGQVTKNLDALYQSLGEMNKLAGDVSKLNRMFSNVKLRGTWGEAQAQTILEDYLAPGQYVLNFKPRSKGQAVVEFAVRLPGKTEDNDVFLPVDSKYPADTYIQYVEACNSGDSDLAKASRKQLEDTVRREARSIRDKYIVPPRTTDFAILFVPAESLYAELLRIDGLSSDLQKEYRVVLAGPANFAALLNSLQMGFKTLQVEKSSKKIWDLFRVVKGQFDKFSEELGRSQQALDEAQSKLSLAVSRSSKITTKFASIEIPEEPKAEYAELTSTIE